MRFQKIGLPLGSVSLVVGDYYYDGGLGVAVALGERLHPKDSPPERYRWLNAAVRPSVSPAP